MRRLKNKKRRKLKLKELKHTVSFTASHAYSPLAWNAPWQWPPWGGGRVNQASLEFAREQRARGREKYPRWNRRGSKCMTNNAACPPRNETKPRRRAGRRFVPIVGPVSLQGNVAFGSPVAVSGRHQMTLDKGTTNWYHPNDCCSSRKIRPR